MTGGFAIPNNNIRFYCKTIQLSHCKYIHALMKKNEVTERWTILYHPSASSIIFNIFQETEDTNNLNRQTLPVQSPFV